MDTTAQRVARNTLWLLSQAVLGRLLSFILIIYLARKLGDLNFGKFCFASAFVQIFLIIADLGISILTKREVARDRGQVAGYFRNGCFIKVMLSLFAFALMIIFAQILKCPADTRTVIYLIGLCGLVESLGHFCGAIFNAFEQMKYPFLAETVEKIFRVLLCFLFLSLGYGLMAIALLYLLSGVFYMGLNLVLLFRKIVPWGFRLEPAFAWRLFRASLPLALSGLLLMLYHYIDAVMLGMMKGELVVGWYSVAYQMYLVLGIMASVFLSAAFPVMSRLFKTSADSLSKVYAKCFKYLLVIGVPLSLSGVILGKRIVLLFYGDGYLNAVLPFQLIVAVIAFSYINSLLGHFLTAVDRVHNLNKLFTISVFTNVGLNLVLIPEYSYAGAAIATMASEILFCVFCLIYVRRYCFYHIPWNLILKACAASGIMGIFIRLFLDINLAVLISSGMAIYFVCLRFLGYFNREDKLLFREVMRI